MLMMGSGSFARSPSRMYCTSSRRPISRQERYGETISPSHFGPTSSVKPQIPANSGQDGKQRKFERALRRLGEVADAYMETGRKYSVDGRMSEQIHR